MAATELLQVLPLVSGLTWILLALFFVNRSRLRSPLEALIALFAFLIGAWALLDWIFLGLRDPSQAAWAVAISNVRISLITLAMLALLVAIKWLDVGHSRYDALLLLPVLGSLAIIWTGLTSGVEIAWWGPRLVRDPLRYSLWAAQQVSYLGAATLLAARLYMRRRDMPRALRLRIVGIMGSLLSMLLLWLSTNIYNNVTQTAGIPWFSSLLLVPAAIAGASLLPLSPRELAQLFRSVSATERHVVAAYLFHRSGAPLVALGSSRNLPIEAEQLEGVLTVVGDFVETSVNAKRGRGATGLAFDELGLVAVRGDDLIAAAVYDGPVYDAVRSELTRIVHRLEAAHAGRLTSWDDALRIAEEAAEELSALVARPTAEAGRPWRSSLSAS